MSIGNTKELNELEKLAEEMRKEYHREYARKNKEKIKKNINNYWLRKAQKKLDEQNKNT